MNIPRAYDARFKTHFRMLLAGPSGSGKTLWVYQLIKYHNLLLDKPPAKILFYYSIWQPIYSELTKNNIVSEFRKGFPTIDEIEDLNTYSNIGGSLVIIDDQALNIDKNAAKIFTVTARHSAVSLILLTQNLFMKQPFFRDISLQATYIVLFKNPRDRSAIKYLAQQIMPNNTQFVLKTFDNALKSAYSYLIIDLHQQTNDNIRYRTNIFPHEKPLTVYVPRL